MSSSSLKIIAVLSMTLDHIGAILFPDIIILRVIGRLAFPIYCFLLVEGYYNTKNLNKYIMRIGLFIIFSEIPFNLAFYNRVFYIQNQNVFVTLFIGILAIYFYDKNKDNMYSILYIIAFAFINEVLNGDYGFYGIFMIFGFYLFHNNIKKIAIYLIYFNISFSLYILIEYKYIHQSIIIQLFSLCAIPLIYYYNGKRGLRFKYIFYFFYPMHLVILFLIDKWML